VVIVANAHANTARVIETDLKAVMTGFEVGWSDYIIAIDDDLTGDPLARRVCAAHRRVVLLGAQQARAVEQVEEDGVILENRSIRLPEQRDMNDLIRRPDVIRT